MTQVNEALAALWKLEATGKLQPARLRRVLAALQACEPDLLEAGLRQAFVDRGLEVPELPPLHRWTWEQQQLVRRPRTLDELLEDCAGAHPVGRGHSLHAASGPLVDLAHFDKVERVEDALAEDTEHLVRVGAGITLGALADVLARDHKQLVHFGGQLTQSLAGAINTGQHAPGGPSLASAVVSVDVVLRVPGTDTYAVQRFEPTEGPTDPARCPFPLHQDDGTFGPMLVNRGTLGLACAYTVRVEDAAHLEESRASFTLEDDLADLLEEVRTGSSAVVLEVVPTPTKRGHRGSVYRYRPLPAAQVDEDPWITPPTRDETPLAPLEGQLPERLLGWVCELAPQLTAALVASPHTSRRPRVFASTIANVLSRPIPAGFRTARRTVSLEDLPSTLEQVLGAGPLLPVRVVFSDTQATLELTEPWHRPRLLDQLQPPAEPVPAILQQRALRMGVGKGGNPLRELMVRGKEQALGDDEARALLAYLDADPEGFARDLEAVSPPALESKGKKVWKDWLGGHRRNVTEPRKQDIADLNKLKAAIFGPTGPLIRGHGAHHADNWVSPPDDGSLAIQLKGNWPNPPKLELEVFTRPDGRTFVRAYGWETLASLFDRLTVKGYAIINTGSFSGQSIAGPLSVGTHGSGIDFGSMTDGVTSFDVLGADMNVRRIRKPSCPAPHASVVLPNGLGTYFPLIEDIPLDLGIVNLGCFGIVLSYVIEVTQDYQLAQLAENLPLDEAIPLALGDLDSFRHVELVVSPEPVKLDGASVQATVVRRRFPQAGDPTNPKPPLPGIVGFLAKHRWLLPPIAQIIQHTALIREAVFEGALKAQQPFRGSWRDVLIRDTGIAAHGFEIFVPLEHTDKAIRAVLKGIETSTTVDKVRPTAPFGVRFVKAGDQALGMNYRVLDGKTYDAWCTIEVSRLYGSKSPDTIPQRILEQLDADTIPYRTHWGQAFPQTVDLPSRYDQLPAWLAARDKIDPTERFFPRSLKAKLTNASRALLAAPAASTHGERRLLFVSANPGNAHAWQPDWIQALEDGCATRDLRRPFVEFLPTEDLFDRYSVSPGEMRSALLEVFGPRSRYSTLRDRSRQWLDELPAWWEWDPEHLAKWLCHAELRELLRLRLFAAICAFQPDAVVGHSLGSLIAYDTLTFAGTRTPKRMDLVTLGSPIALPGLRYQWGGVQAQVPGIRHWFNVHHREDPLFARPIGRPPAHDLELAELGDLHPHAAVGYLRDPKVARDVWSVVLGNASPRERTLLHATAHARTPRRALLVGINRYLEPGFPDLSGCVNDAFAMSELLQSKYGYRSRDIRVLTDERATTDALRDRLEWLLAGTTSMDQRVFYFSGHGTQLPAYNAVEVVDRVDECLVTHDFDWNTPHRTFIDDDFLELYTQLPRDARFTAVFDCCHAAGMSRAGGASVRGIQVPDDIRHRMQQFTAGRWRNRRPEPRATAIRQPEGPVTQAFIGSAQAFRSRGSVVDASPALRGHGGPYLPVLLFAAQERELAFEHQDGRTVHGAFTWALLQALQRNPHPTFADLLPVLSKTVAEVAGEQHPELEGPSARLDDKDRKRGARFSF